MTATDLIDILESAGYDVAPYSGRSMYGNECVGVELDSDDDLWTLAQTSQDIPRPTTDNLGRGIIAYWPRLKWPEQVA